MNNSSIKILIVEDNPGDARLIEEMLKDVEDINFDIIHVVRLDEGLKYILTKNFDVILLDLCLPDSEGIDTFNIMSYNAPGIPIIVLTGLEDEMFALSAVGKGAEEYLIKGEVNCELLLKSIRRSIDQKAIKNLD